MAPTAVFAQFPPPPPWRRAGLRRSRPGVLPLSAGVLLPWGLAVRPVPASAVRLLAWAPALVLAAISGRLAASVPAVVADPRLHARSRLALHRSATAVPEASAMAMAGGDTVMVQPMPLEPMPAMAMAARTMAIIPTATATTPTVATDAFWFATNNHELRTSRCVSVSSWLDRRQQRRANGTQSVAARVCERARLTRSLINYTV